MSQAQVKVALGSVRLVTHHLGEDPDRVVETAPVDRGDSRGDRLAEQRRRRDPEAAEDASHVYCFAGAEPAGGVVRGAWTGSPIACAH